ncbi:DUF5819 family protein [Streptomyces katsurahamanus]|uniref:DUF5819 family protein n=1 Tax=Streptomyces katsurahamanus TaxID=2577098 RepID=UPI001886A1FD|nr:DUF5819 family protein [Streptomyces katsurahamanus]
MGSHQDEGVEHAGGTEPNRASGRSARTLDHPPEQRGPEPDGSPSPSGRPPSLTGDAPSGEEARGLLALSTPYRMAAGAALALIAAVVCVHVAMVFLHVAPSNTVTKKYGKAIDAWVYPEFEQNWKLFAPNPLQQNVSVQVKAEVRTHAGGRETTDWIDLTAEDAAAIRGNPLPSHVQQNTLRRAWDFYTGSHDDKDRSTGHRGALSESYLRRIAMLRLDSRDLGGVVERVQFRSVTQVIEPPPWSQAKTDTRPVPRVLPWWPVTEADRPGGAGDGGSTAPDRTEAAR